MAAFLSCYVKGLIRKIVPEVTGRIARVSGVIRCGSVPQTSCSVSTVLPLSQGSPHYVYWAPLKYTVTVQFMFR